MNRVELNRIFLNATSLNRVGSRRGASLGIPSGYIPLEYIENKGNGYVDTGVVIASFDVRVSLDAEFVDITASSPEMAWGYMAGSSNVPRWGFGIYSSKWLGAPNTTSSIGTPDTGRHTFVMAVTTPSSGDAVYSGEIDGESLYTSAKLTNADSFGKNTIPTYLFARNNSGTAGNFGHCRIYGFKVVEGNKTTADLRPCMDKDGAVGFYDVVGRRFCKGQGSGLVGKEFYKELEGFAYDGGCYFEIEGFPLKGSDTLRFSFDVEKACNVIGCYTSTSAQDNYDLYVSLGSGSKYLRYNGGTYPSQVGINTRYDVVITPTGCTGLPDDSTWTEKTFTSPVDMLVGATTKTGTSSKLVGNMYGHIIVDGRLDLIPVERVRDGVLGYYDAVGGVFYEPVEGMPTSLGYKAEGGGEIEFTIKDYNGEDRTFKAREGMTWEEFLNSEYNTEEWYYDGWGILLYSEDGQWMASNYYLYYGGYVQATDTITSNHPYYISA